MTNEADAAPVAAEPTTAPETGATAPETNVIEETPRGAIDRAFEAVEAKETESSEDAKPSEIDGKTFNKKMDNIADKLDADKPADKTDGKPERNPDGTFRAKAVDEHKAETEAKPQKDGKTASESFNEAPNRFSVDAKEVWKDAPLPVRAEIHRMEREFSAGIEQYKGDAEAFATYRDFDKYLNEKGQKFEEVLGHYTGIENMLRENPMQGLEQICRNIGTDLHTVAAAVMGQSPDEHAQHQNAEIVQLRDEIKELKGQLGGVTTTIADQRTTEATNQVNAFRADNPRFDELAKDIAFFMKTGRAPNLKDAYDMAERLNPAPATKESETAHTRTDDAAHTRDKTKLSVDGGPGKGSKQTSRKPPDTAHDAVNDAFASLGIG